MGKKHVTLERMARGAFYRESAERSTAYGGKAYIAMIRSSIKLKGTRAYAVKIVRANSRKHAKAMVVADGFKVYKIVKIKMD